MSAATPLPDERRAAFDVQLFEPSMEDILASIRRIIADDQSASSAEALDAAPGRDRLSADRISASQGEGRNGAGQTTAYGHFDPQPADAAAASAHEAEPARACTFDAVQTSPSPHSPCEALVSAAADTSVATAFNTLVASRFVQNSAIIAALTNEALRPMLRAWLDEHLPPLVERLVKAEIERITRGA